MTDLCRTLEWDTQFWGFHCAAITTRDLREDQVPGVDSWCSRNDVRFLQYLAPLDDHASVDSACNAGFRLVDIRLTLRSEFGLKDENPSRSLTDWAIAPSHLEDLDQLDEIARHSHSASRYYYDGLFPRAGCDLLYATWIRRSHEGFADTVLVARANGQVIGYITCKQGKNRMQGSIGLVGVSTKAQGLGVGRALLGAAMDWFRSVGVVETSVVTQGRNYAAQRLYQRSGFITHDLSLWFHKWYPSR